MLASEEWFWSMGLFR